MKKRINIYGSGWTNQDVIQVSKNLKNIEWVLDGSGKANFYPNTMTHLVLEDKTSLPKFAWLNESIEVDTYSHNKILTIIEYFDIIFTHNKLLYSKYENIKFVPASCYWIKAPDICKKSKLISMISSSKNFTYGHKHRINWMSKLKNKVDLYGQSVNPILYKEQGLNDYMFSVAIENAKYPSYFTEKILDCFATGTIPIYWGTDDIKTFFNADGIIELKDNFDPKELNKDFYYDRIQAIKDNLEKVMEYSSVEDYMYKNYLSERLS